MPVLLTVYTQIAIDMHAGATVTRYVARVVVRARERERDILFILGHFFFLLFSVLSQSRKEAKERKKKVHIKKKRPGMKQFIRSKNGAIFKPLNNGRTAT